MANYMKPNRMAAGSVERKEVPSNTTAKVHRMFETEQPTIKIMQIHNDNIHGKWLFERVESIAGPHFTSCARKYDQ